VLFVQHHSIKKSVYVGYNNNLPTYKKKTFYVRSLYNEHKKSAFIYQNTMAMVNFYIKILWCKWLS